MNENELIDLLSKNKNLEYIAEEAKKRKKTQELISKVPLDVIEDLNEKKEYLKRMPPASIVDKLNITIEITGEFGWKECFGIVPIVHPVIRISGEEASETMKGRLQRAIFDNLNDFIISQSYEKLLNKYSEFNEIYSRAITKYGLEAVRLALKEKEK